MLIINDICGSSRQDLCHKRKPNVLAGKDIRITAVPLDVEKAKKKRLIIRNENAEKRRPKEIILKVSLGKGKMDTI